MKRLLFTVLLLFIISPGFAQDYTFTNEDLILYTDEYMNYKEPSDLSDDNKENAYINEKGEVIKYGTDRSENRRAVQPRNLTGESCDVLDFSSNKIDYAVHNPNYEISGTITKQTVTLRIKSKWHMPLWVENFYIIASFEDGSEQTKQLQPAPGDSLTSWIQPNTEYVGYVTLDGDLPIASVGCHVIK